MTERHPPAFQQYQHALSAHVRDPRHAPRPPGATRQRIGIYNELLFNNLQSFLLACFPVCRDILGVRRWTKLTRAFFRDWPCATPLFRHIPEEFVRYLQSSRTPVPGEPPFLVELADYEWLELAADVAPEPWPEVAAEWSPADQEIVLNPVLFLVQYRYPVHRLSRSYQPAHPPAEPTCLMVFRDADDEVQFAETNPVTLALLQQLWAHPDSGSAALEALARRLAHPDPQAMQRHGLALLDSLRQQGVVVGGRVIAI